MADPYYRYGTPSDRASIPRSSFAGYPLSEAPPFASPHVLNSSDLRGAGLINSSDLRGAGLLNLTDLRGAGSDYLQKDINLLHNGAYSVDDSVGIRVHSEPAIVTTETNIKGCPSLEYTDLISQKRDIPLGINPDVPGITNGRPVSKSNYDVLPTSAGESNVLFVGGLPSNCTRREVGHLFRPFIGYKDIRVVHKGPRRSGDQDLVLCFVEFIDPKCALTAMEALQGYKFDDKKPESQTLKIQFAHFPFRPPPDHGEQLIIMP